MSLTIDELHADGDHKWAVMTATCDLSDTADPLITATIADVREAYGQNQILAAASSGLTILQPDSLVSRTFDLTAIEIAVKLGLPNPDDEGDKPEALTNYRSECTEIIARRALKEAFGIEFPTAPQRGKTNPNMPILGFDGWGLFGSPSGGYSLVLVQVKGTEATNRPPAEAKTLAEECKNAPNNLTLICRALSVLVHLLEGSSLQQYIIEMLETIGKGNLPDIVIGPVIVRGKLSSHIDDLEPVRRAFDDIDSAIGRGITISIGARLTELGHIVMSQARST
jgi:hypothetical protein